MTWCFQCHDFPCQRLEDFSKIHVLNGIWHHKKVVENLQFMKDHGNKEWIKQHDKEAACPSCEKILYWHSLRCPQCDRPVHQQQFSPAL